MTITSVVVSAKPAVTTAGHGSIDPPPVRPRTFESGIVRSRTDHGPPAEFPQQGVDGPGTPTVISAVTESAAVLLTPSPDCRDTGDVNTTMTEMHDHYVRRVDEAVAADRTDVIRELNEDYVEEALRLILATA